jgi:uncharacterized oxidoreductase
VIGREAMALGIDKAKRAGLCAIAIRNAGHLGRMARGRSRSRTQVSHRFHFVNTSGFGILVAPHGGKDRRLSANPIAAGAPGDAPIILDISTSAIAGRQDPGRDESRRDAAARLHDRQRRSAERGAGDVLRSAGWSAVAGRGHKGYGLSVFCEIFAGALSGGLTTNPANATANRLVNNMLSIVFDADAFCGAQAFREEIARMASWVRASPPIAAGSDVLLPGEIERRTRAQRERDGVPLDAATRHQIAAAVRPFALRCPGVRSMNNPVRDKLRAGGTPMGVMAFDFFTPGLAPTLAQAGAEFVLLDMEHSGAGIDTIKTQCALRAAPASCRWCAFPRACIT